MRLLLVEDDTMIGTSMQQALQREGFAVDWTQDGVAAELATAAQHYDLILLDLSLPRRDGIDLLKRWRQVPLTVPVLVVTARDTVAARVQGLDSGADDYLVKPFDLDELLARVRALLRRSTGRADPEIRIGALRLNPVTHEAWLQETRVPLSGREFELLHILVAEPGKPFSRAALEERLYGWGEEVESNAVEVHIHALRRKLGSEWVRNVRGVGYLVPRPT